MVATATVAFLLLLAAPTLHTKWSGVDASVLPTSQSARSVQDTIAQDFPAYDSAPTFVVVKAPPTATAALSNYAHQLARLGGVTSVSRPRLLAGNLWQIELATSGSAIGRTSQNALAAVRSAGSAYPVKVGGAAAEFHDQQASIAGSLSLSLGVLALATLVILWLMTGSVILPLKALAMNALTVGAALGLLVFIFQQGRFSGALNYTSQGGIVSTDFLVLAAIVFGLSTDYGVILLTRIKEGHDAGLTNREAVAGGLQHTGRLVTAAAIMLAVALGAFATSHVIFIKELGVGTAAAVLIDAFVIRALLVPALMALLNEWNWWSPEPLRKLHRRLHIDENPGVSPRLAPAPAAPAAVPV
jgi:RND superfamily putative drug exporter